jgi:hypothetical protein
MPHGQGHGRAVLAGDVLLVVEVARCACNSMLKQVAAIAAVFVYMSCRCKVIHSSTQLSTALSSLGQDRLECPE